MTDERAIAAELGRLYPRLPYLPLLHAHPARLPAALRACAEAERAPGIDRAMRAALDAVNWRGHLPACGILLVRAQRQPIDERMVSALWGLIDRWSWVVPQCCATAAMLDPDFARRVEARLDRLLEHGPEGGPSAKALQALQALSDAPAQVEQIRRRLPLVEWLATADHRPERAVRWQDAVRRALAGPWTDPAADP